MPAALSGLIIKGNTMAPKKESVEINCTECDTRFRLWIPEEVLPEWERGARISCVRCGAQYFISKTKKGLEVSLLKELVMGERQAAPKRESLKQAAPKKEPVKQAAPLPRTAPPKEEPLRTAPVRKEVKAAPAPASAAPPQDAVLVVEDDRLAREMAEHSLKDLGVKLIPVKNASEALRVISRENVRIIVTDLYLKNPADPESLIDGEELLKKILDSGLNIPAVITTGKDIVDDLVLDPKWFDLHVKGFIQKGNPFWAEDLKLKIKEILYKD